MHRTFADGFDKFSIPIGFRRFALRVFERGDDHLLRDFAELQALQRVFGSAVWVPEASADLTSHRTRSI